MANSVRIGRQAGRFSSLIKASIIGAIVLVLLIPLVMIRSLVGERQARRAEAEAEMFSSWGGEQTVGGPILTVPYILRGVDAAGKATESVALAHFLPSDLSIRGSVSPEKRRRGMYEATLYTGKLSVKGSFAAPDFSGWRVDLADILWTDAFLSVELPDMRALQDRVSLSWGTWTTEFRPGRGSAGLFPGEIRAAVRGLAPARPGAVFPFSFELGLRGGGGLSFLPLGDQTSVRIISPWKSPTFQGSFLPGERTLSEQGFDASWKVISLARPFPQRWRGGEVEPFTILSSGFGVNLMTPVDSYLKVTRALKYGILFVFLPFLTLFLFEVFSARRIHPLQYLFVGLADCVFYLLLLSLSEHAGFDLAYWLAAGASTAMIAAYSCAVVTSVRQGLLILPVLAGADAFLFVVLRSEDSALLIGSLGLFLILGAVMALTRKVDWYTVGTRPAVQAAGGQAAGERAAGERAGQP
jgi:inner membrane protein